MAASLELAISAIRSGRKEEGRQLLNLLIQQNPNDEKAWMWMSSVVDTDEQRARCLYHVLAVNPNSEIARRGLQVLGIVVSDSRPVKVPRDSQPIKIPKPSPPPASQSNTPVERRPFLIDPQTVTQELPFTPLEPPFSVQVQASPAVLAIDVTEDMAAHVGAAPVESAPSPAKPVPVKDAGPPAKSGLLARLAEPTPSPAATDTQELNSPATGPTEQPSNPALGVTAEKTQQLPPGSDSQPVQPVVTPGQIDTQELSSPAPMQPNPSEPVPVIQPNMNPGMMPQSQVQPGQMMPMPGQLPMPGTGPINQTQQPPFHGAPIPNDTRPSQPMPVIYPNQNVGMVQHDSTPIYPYPSQMPAHHAHSATTAGMPLHHQPMPSSYYPQPVPSLHSNTTMGMPLHAQHPSEPVPVIHSSGTLGLAPYGHGQSSPPPQNMAFHSSSTMMMPSMSEAEARARLATNSAIPTANATAMALQNPSYQAGMAGHSMAGMGHYSQYDAFEDEDEEDEVNILAVIIFGTLSITALGGLGMLILLVFTAPAV